MPLTRLDNLISSKTGKYLYVSPDDFNATDSLSNRGNSPVTPFKSIQRAFLEIARYSYTPGPSNDRFDQFTVMLMPGIHYIDNRPGLVDTSGIEAFDFSQALESWGDDPILDISNPDNVLYKFNNTEGGAIIPRGSSLVGYDLRRTTVRPLYVPEPSSVTYPRSAIFNVTGGCYFWQFTIKDGQTTAESPLYNPSIGSGEVYYDPYDFTKKAIPNFSHHKLTVFEYADKEELQLYYRKVAKAFEKYQPTINTSVNGVPEFDFNVQENRIVGPLSDSRVIESLKFNDIAGTSSCNIEVTTKVDHGYFAGQFVAISGTDIDEEIEGFWPIYEISDDPRKFSYRVPFVVSGIGQGLTDNKEVSVNSAPALGQNAQVLAEVDSVESASPYVFNVSIRSVWGICGIWANGLKATGFKSMVIAQYTGVSLQRDDRAFIRYDEYANTWNQASLVDAFATVPYHAKGDSYWKDDWRNFHVRASDDAFIQNVSIFAVGFADHFLMESGGDMSITNSNSNFGNTSLHAIGFKGFSFNQDKAGYITDIIPPSQVVEDETNVEKVLYYTLDVQGTKAEFQSAGVYKKLFLGGVDLDNPLVRPAATIGGYRIGAKSGDTLYVKDGGIFEAELSPTGFVKYIAKASTLNPTTFTIDNNNVDGANLIESNRTMIQEEVFGYILEKYPRLQNISYVNPALNPAANRYFDAKNLILANRQEIVDTAFDQMVETFGIGNIQGVADGKCKRDIGFIVDAVAEDLRDGGNRNIIEATKFYFDGNDAPITNGLVGEEDQSVFAFNRARDLCKKAIANLLTVKATIYDPNPNSPLAPYGIVAGNTGSAALGLDSEGVTIDAANLKDPASRYKDARNRIVANREFILDAAVAEIAVYHPDFVIPGLNGNHSTTRFADAYKSIRRNSKEIRDNALAAINLAHPDFYFPGDPQTDERSRYADAHRLIQANKDEILDRSLAQIAVEHPDFYFPGEPQTDGGSRYADSYRLIQQNRTEIVDTAWTNMVGAYPGVASVETKCKRDIGIFVDSISLDIFMGGNKYARKFISEYFDDNGNPINNGLVGEETESQRAFEEARDLMKQAITNQLSVQDLSITPDSATGNNLDPTSCADVQSAIDSLTTIVTDVLQAGTLSGMVAETGYTSGVVETKCRRDIGYFVDAVSLDLFINGNEYSHRFAAEYFSNATTPITNGLVGEEAQSITAFNKAADMMKKALTNQLYEKDLTVTADNSPGNPYGQVTQSFTPHFATYDPNTGVTVLSIAKHGLSVGDFIELATGSIQFTCDLDGNNQIAGYPRSGDPAWQKLIRIDAVTVDTITINVGDGNTNFSNHTFSTAQTGAVTFAGNTANQNKEQQLLCSDVQSAVDSLSSIITTIIATGNLSTLPLEINKGQGGPGETKCARDIGYFIDAIAVDVYTGSNKHTRTFIQQYFDGNAPITNGLLGEESESVTAFGAASDFMIKAVTNQLYDKDLTVTPDPLTNDNQDPNSCANVQSEISVLATYVTDAITAGNLNNLPAETPSSLEAAEIKCRRDIGHVVDAIAQDLWFGGNEYTIAATKEYFNGNSLITNGVDNEVGPAITCFKRAEDLMQRALNNVYYDRDLNITLDTIGDPTIVGDIECDAHDMVLANVDFIAAEAYERMLAAYPSYTPSAGNTAQDCRDDVVSVLKEVMWDVKFGGNSKTYDAANIYVTNYDYRDGNTVETFIDAERDEAAKVMTEAKNIAMQVIKNEAVSVSAGNSLTQSIDTTIVNDWDADALLPRCGSAVAAVDTLMGIIIQAIGNDSGVGTLTATRTTGAPADPAYNTAVNLSSASGSTLSFTVGTSTHVYPHTFVKALPGAIVSGGAYDHRFVSVAADAVGWAGGGSLTPINATYDATTGLFVIYTQNAHGLNAGSSVTLADNSFTFKCAMDDYTAQKSYPRPGVDPYAGQSITIASVTDRSITLNVGTSPLVEHDVTDATYDPATGVVTVTTSAPHNIDASTSIRIKTESLTFTCTKDQNVTTHSYPRAAKAYQPATYAEGNCSDVLATVNTLTSIVCDALVAGNLDDLPSLSTGNWDCANVRSSIENLFDIITDAISSGSIADLPVVNPGDFTLNATSSKCYRDVAYIVDAIANDLKYGGNINSVQAGEAYFVGTSSTRGYTPTDATYDPATGDFTVTIGNHGIEVGRRIRLADNGFTFTCGMDNDQTQKTYPRPGIDPYAGRSIQVTAVTPTTVTVNVGASGPNVSFTPSNATYDPTTGVMEITIGAHTLSVGEGVVLEDNSFTFTCALDNNATQHTYPRPGTDPFAGRSIAIEAVTATTITVNVGTSSDTSAHTFVTAANDAVKHLPQTVHTFVSATTDSVIAGGAQLEYIDGEKAETIDAWNYVGSMAIAAMRNFDFVAWGCGTVDQSDIVDVGDTSGILIGMRVEEYLASAYRTADGAPGLLKDEAKDPATKANYLVTSTIPAETYVKEIIDSTTIRLGVKDSRLDTGNSVVATDTYTAGGALHLHFMLEEGAWADTLPQTVTVAPESEDPDVIADTTVSTSQRECASTAAAIIQLTDNITTIIETGLTKIVNGVTVPTVDRVEPTFNTALLAQRATIWTIDIDGSGAPNPHDFETGTPVRLVPRPRFDRSSGKFVDVDKRLVRLPNGFDTNTTYYVIAPGRSTREGGVEYNNSVYFNGQDQTKLMLATSKENAAAGIYIYASEVDVIDPDVEIDMYQFVLDNKYDLITYIAETNTSVDGGIQTDIAHFFDVPSASTTPQTVFFRGVSGATPPILAQDFQSDPAVAAPNANFIDPNKEFYVRYVSPKVFTIHKTQSDAQNNLDPIKLNPGEKGFRVFMNKKRSPMRFDPTFTDAVTTTGKWYLQTADNITGETDQTVIDKQIYSLLGSSDYQGKDSTTDTWYERVNDTREANDRTYKLRYVIPKYIENARDPINGFVLKTRTDDTRKLVPQKILLKPVSGNVYGARFAVPGGTEYIGDTIEQLRANNLTPAEDGYDPYNAPIYARFTSGIQATIQSGRYITDRLDENIQYLELTVFDHTVDTVNFSGLRNEIFTTVKITAPQGGTFVTNKTQSISTNTIGFSGNSSGTAYIHGYYNVGGDHYLIIKGISGAKGSASLEYSEFQSTRFQQGAVFADMLEDQDMGKSLPLKTHIKKNYPEYYYKQNGSNVYTITPGDTIQDSAGNQYYVETVEDTGVIEDTFYIFDSAELQKRIFGQQDGIYYLTALRGNISPFPQGAGVSTNFRKFKFSQPVGKLYPLNYRNDPLWFKKDGTSNEEKDYYAQLIDPPQSYSAADNYIHGKVTVNDVKGSVTRELVIDLLKQPAFIENEYTTDTQDLKTVIEAQQGNASAGSEDRVIPIAGDNRVWTDQRYYVELRRPSIARAGNHTFEYLGFGPGNYSTGLPARQEIVLTPDEDFYAQSKKQDAGIVFYTGINSQGDLYIGNRRINAITGEETFIDRALLADDGDEDDVIGQLVTSFETPVTFNQNITIVGGDDGTLVSNFNSPITITCADGPIPPSQMQNQGVPLIIKSFVHSVDYKGNPQDSEGLDRDLFPLNNFGDNAGDIRIGKNRIDSAIFAFNPRGGIGQGYKIQTHAPGGVASNLTPNQDGLVSAGGSKLNVAQTVSYTNVLPDTGDILLKGGSINKNGSLGWVFANIFNQIPSDPTDPARKIASIEVRVDQNTNIGILTFIDANSDAVSVSSLGIKSTSEIKLENINYSNALNGTWKVLSTTEYPYNPASNVVYFLITSRTGSPIPAFGGTNWTTFVNDPNNPSPNAKVSSSNSNWKETMIIGGEALRTETETYGDFKLGINTVARANHEAYLNGFVESLNTDPRANLDIVGNAYISGRKMSDWLSEDNYNARERNRISDALVVGWEDEASPNSNVIDQVRAALRVSTETVAITESGRGNNENKVGINVTDAELDRALVVRGDARFTEDVRFERDIEINGDGSVAEIRTSETVGTFNFVNDTNFTGIINIANYVTSQANIANLAEIITLGNDTTADQFIRIGQTSLHSNVFLGVTPDDRPSDNALTISKVEIGGAYSSSESLSFTRIKTKSFKVDGDFQLGARRTINDTVTLSTTAGQVDFFSNSGSASVINFGLNASEINIAGQGGTTTINNQLEVIASAEFKGDVKICGGIASFAFDGARGQLGSAVASHEDGIISDTQFNKNVDIINVKVLTSAEAGYNEVDTAGNGAWGGAGFQAPRANLGGTPVIEPQDLPALSGDEYYIPLLRAPLDAQGGQYYAENDFIIINSGVGVSTHPEIVQIVELTRTTIAPYYIKVRRQPPSIGTFTAVLDTHPDRTPIYKVNIQFDATWLEQDVDASTDPAPIYLSEFGGALVPNVDYVILDREDTNGDGIFNQGEVIKVGDPREQNVQRFVITDCGDPETEVFVVDSVTGDITIGGTTEINNTLTIKGGCGTVNQVEFTGSTQANTNKITNLIITTPNATLADIQVGDYIQVITNEAPITIVQDTYIERIVPDSNELWLSEVIGGGQIVSGIQFVAERNEKFIINAGQEDQPVWQTDTCTGTTTLGNWIGRMEIEFARDSQPSTSDRDQWISLVKQNLGTQNHPIVVSYQEDPAVINDGGPSTTIRAAVQTGSTTSRYQIPVQGLGVNDGKFQVGDYIVTGSTSSFGSSGFVNVLLIVDVIDTATPTLVADYIATSDETGMFGSGNEPPETAEFTIGDLVRRVIRHSEYGNILDIEVRTRVQSGVSTEYISVILDKGYIAQTKLDYNQWLDFDNLPTTGNYAKTPGIMRLVARLEGTKHKAVMNEQQRDGAIPFRRGNFYLANDFEMIGGNLHIKDSVGESTIFRVFNDDGHADHQGLIQWNAGIIGRGDFYLFGTSCPENVLFNPDDDTPTFSVDNFGNATVQTTLNITGVAAATPSPTSEPFRIGNLGPNGANDFTVKQDQSIDAFGFTNFYTTTGGRHTRYISAASTEEELNLKSNIIYMVNVQAAQTLIVTLPETAQTGDVIRIIEVGGNLRYDTSLVVRTPETSGTTIQGDAQGTLLGGRLTTYPSGELVVQTPNAAFGLVYLGSTDSNNQTGIPTSVQGWWLMEV